MSASDSGITADLQWRYAKVIGSVKMADGELRWIVERTDGSQEKIRAQVVNDDWKPVCQLCEAREKALVDGTWNVGFRHCPHCGRDW